MIAPATNAVIQIFFLNSGLVLALGDSSWEVPVIGSSSRDLRFLDDLRRRRGKIIAFFQPVRQQNLADLASKRTPL
jgi:hypothetical protein